MDRRKTGSKHHVIVEANGVPLAATLLHRGIARVREAARAGEPLDEMVDDTATVLTLPWSRTTTGDRAAG